MSAPRPRRPFTPQEVQKIVAMCEAGSCLAEISDVTERGHSSIAYLLRSKGLKPKPAGTYRGTARYGKRSPVRKRGTKAPRKLPAAERSTYPVNFAAHARMLRW